MKIRTKYCYLGTKSSQFDPISHKKTVYLSRLAFLDMTTEIEILQYLHYHPLSKRTEIGSAVTASISDRTLKRIIADCVEKGAVEVVGKGPNHKIQTHSSGSCHHAAQS